ncbi:uncharacterized protein EV154DRAFT_501292 [Mucor mucedo]|uniref:uncharacterized protein n=1 Tax=Mucor mucedo TaxID=29922 RepID=UPI002220B09E|nr:uncharacterized protein EV154DRAFT_501292 [Mucor mucedo]KAI7893470.1 hypothetical protein EV154DRAFT_501292 [Mucor mucedo]
MNNTFETFNNYPWQSDQVFQAGLQTILAQLPQDNDHDANLMKAKHFYFSRFQQNFDLEEYLIYQQLKLDEKLGKQKEELYHRLQDYDYDQDEDYKTGLPNIIRGWLKEQSSGLWDKERLELEFEKAKAFYYVSRVEKVNLVEYFAWKAKNETNKPSCPFANLWQNKSIGPVDQINAPSFIVTEKRGPLIVTLSSPKSRNIFSVGRLQDLESALKDGVNDQQVTSLFITATVADSSGPDESNQRIETKDTKILSCGLAYDQTSKLVSGSELRQASLQKLADIYYTVAHDLIENKKLTVTFSNGQIPLNAVYLTLCLGFMRVITEHTLLIFTIELSHAPIPPLLLLAMARARTKGTKPLPAGMELYLALAAPEYAKLRGPEILRLGLADVFVPEAKLSDAFTTAKNMAVCPPPDTTASIQLALAIHHTYSGPNRLSVWEEHIENVFGAATSFDDLQQRLELLGNQWSRNILNHWKTLPSTLLKVIFRAVQQCKDMAPFEILKLEKDLNSKWRQTDDYKIWLRSQNTWSDDASVDFYFEKVQELDTSDSVVYEAVQEQSLEAVCPVTGQKATQAKCPFNKEEQTRTCPVSGQKTLDTENTEGCPFNKKSDTAISALEDLTLEPK